MEAETTILTREQIAEQYQWNAPSVFPSRADWEAEADALVADIPSLEAFRGRLSESPAVLADVLDLGQSLMMRLSKLAVYSGMATSVDTNDQQALAMRGRFGAIAGKFSTTFGFVSPEIIALGKDAVDAWIQQEPRLAYLQQFVDNQFRLQKHIRSAEVEALLGMVSEPLQATNTVYGQLTDADMVFPTAHTSEGVPVEVAQSSMPGTKVSSDRELRRTAYESYADEYLAHKKTIAATLIGSYKADVFMARARNFETALERSLSTHNVPTTVYHNLIDTFKKNLPTWHKYWRVRRKALGVETLQPYDIWAPLRENKPHVPYEQAVDWICEGMAPLGEDYVSVMRRGCLEDRWVDVYPNVGKSQGAFSSGAKGTHPFIMMSYSDTLESLSTLAHELGHSMHSYYTRGTQPMIYANYSMFVAETASNFNQALVRDHLFASNPDPEFQIALIEEAMSNFHRYFFIMPTLARFELEIHTRVEAGKSPTADDMITLCADLFAEGYGSEMTFDREREGITWAQFRHLYNPYYVFNYATGMSAAHAISRRILDGIPGSVEAYRKALTVGSSVYPVETIQMAGVDMSTPEPVEQTFAILAAMVDRLEILIG